MFKVQFKGFVEAPDQKPIHSYKECGEDLNETQQNKYDAST